MIEWKLTEEQIQKILDTPPIKLPVTEERKREIERAKNILEKWKERRDDTRK